MSVIVDFIDGVHQNMWDVTLTDKDEVFINETWYKEDELLVGLSNTPPFAGCTTWADLDILHYQILFMKCFEKLHPNHTTDEVVLRFREPFATFRFLASAVVKMSNINGLTGFDTVVISRPRDSRVVIDFRKTYRFDWDSYAPPIEAPKPKPVFQLVVDNTKNIV